MEVIIGALISSVQIYSQYVLFLFFNQNASVEADEFWMK